MGTNYLPGFHSAVLYRSQSDIVTRMKFYYFLLTVYSLLGSFVHALHSHMQSKEPKLFLVYFPTGVLEASQDFLHLLRSVIHDYSLTTLKKNHVDIIASAIKSKAK